MIKFSVDASGISTADFKQACSAAETVLALQVLKDTRPFVPALTMSLNQRSHVSGNQVIYPGPYARYLYYGKVMVDSKTGKGPMKIPDVGLRFKKGAVLKATEKDLVFTKTVHGQAQAHWFEASKAQNIRKWERVLEKAVTENI